MFDSIIYRFLDWLIAKIEKIKSVTLINNNDADYTGNTDTTKTINTEKKYGFRKSKTKSK